MMIRSGSAYTRAGAYMLSGFSNASGVAARLQNPRGLTVGPDNSVYVADNGNHVIRKIAPFTSLGNAQAVTVFAGKFAEANPKNTAYPGYADGAANVAQFSYPSGLCSDPNGNIYVADMGNHAIRKITPAGVVSTIAGNADEPGSADGNALTQARFNNPSDVFYKDGMLYIADLFNSMVRVLNLSAGTVTTLPKGDANLWTPSSITAAKGIVYFSDQHRIFKQTTTAELYAGSPTLNVSGYVNGKGTAAKFYDIKGMMYSQADTAIYIADFGNHVIRKLTFPAEVSVETQMLQQTKVYPNPSESGIFRIELPQDGALYYTVYDITGSIIMTQHNTNISGSLHVDLSSFAKGVYLINVVLKDGYLRERLLYMN